MTPLLWMLSWLPQVLPAVSDLPRPVNISLTSNNFIHLLRWEPGPGSPRGVHYNVYVHSEKGTSWEPVGGCEHVQRPLFCNLTEALSDPKQLYFSRVRALLGNRTSEPAVGKAFLPIKETELDLPLLTVAPCGRDLCVDLQPPMEHLRKIYNSLSYTLSVRRGDADRAEFFRNTMSLKREVFEDLAPSRAYCFSVSISDSLVPRRSNYSQPECAVTTGVFTADDVVISVGLCLLLVSCVAIVALLVRAGVLCLQVKALPHVLTSIRHMEAVVVVVPCRAALSPLSNVKETPPSTCGKRNSHSSDDSEVGSETASSAGGTGGGYELRVSTKRRSAFVWSSSSSSSSPSSPPPAALPNCCTKPNPVSLTSLSFSSGYDDSRSQLSPPPTLNPQPEAVMLVDHHLTPPIKRALTTDPTSPSDSVLKTDQGAVGPHHHHHMDSFNTAEGVEPKEEEGGAVGDGSVQDVNLLTLTMGECEEEEDVGQPRRSRSKVEPSSVESSYDADPLLPPRAGDATSVDEEEEDEDEEEEECSGYLTRPRAAHR